MNLSLAESLWQADADLAAACLRHPFVRGLADGSLPLPRYRDYVAQDAFFLRAFADAYRRAAAAARDAEGQALYDELRAGVEAELVLHRSMAQRHGIDLATVVPSDATLAYTEFLTATAATRPEASTAAAMLPCLRLYAFLGAALLPTLVPGSPYADWVTTYADAGFAALWQRLAARLPIAAANDRVGADELAALHRRAMHLEHRFFAAAWGGAAPGRPAVALSIAGSDPSGGAGVQADLKTFHRFGVYGQAVVTLLTAQNTRGVQGVFLQSPEVVRAQLNSVLDDLGAAATKIGALGSPSLVAEVAAAVRQRHLANVVLDPVLVSKHGHALADAPTAAALRRELLPLVLLVTPNRFEAEQLSGLAVRDRDSAWAAGQRLCAEGAQAAVIKDVPGLGGDLLVTRDGVREFVLPRVATRHRHGTGCSFSAAIAARLAVGDSLPLAVGVAADFLVRALASAPGLGDTGPINHWA